MKLNSILASLAACLSLGISAQAASPSTNVLDWTFSVAGNPAAPNAATTLNPSGGNPQATIFGNNNTYFFGTGPLGLYGSPTGLWDVEGGHVTLTLDLLAQPPGANYTLQIYQFADEGRSFYPGTLTLSPVGAQFVSESVYVPQSGNMIGAWYVDTYSWTSVITTPRITLDIAPGAGSPALLLDELKLTVVGTLIAPEPGCGLIAALGLVTLGIRSWLRRKS
jgi:hypothetical protein